MSEIDDYGNCMFCGETLRRGDWVINSSEIRKLVVDPDNVPEGMAHKDCVVHTPGI